MRRRLSEIILVFVLATGVLSAAGRAVPQHLAAAQVETPVTVLELRDVVDGLIQPTQVTNADDGSGRLFVVERGGTIRVLQNDQLDPVPFLDITDRVISGAGELGLFSVAFHPDFKDNGYLYVFYTAAPDGSNTITRFTATPDTGAVDPDTALKILAIPDMNDTHNGGGLAFGPDGYLYAGTGDGGGPGDPDGNSQNRNSLLGKILRLDVDGGAPYTIPANNPFVHTVNTQPEIWALGLRNPWRIDFDSVDGSLYIADVGSGAWEEIDIQSASSIGGENYGWPLMEGRSCLNSERLDCDIEKFVLPEIVYDHDKGCAIVGGQVYRGLDAPSVQGNYIYGDWCSGQIWMASRSQSGTWKATELQKTGIQITSIGASESGELYLTDMIAGRVLRLNFLHSSTDLTIAGLTPDTAYAGGDSFTLTIHGSGFTTQSTVQWNSLNRETTFVSAAELQADIPATDLSLNFGDEPTTEATITVVQPGVDGSISNPIPFSITLFGDLALRENWLRTDGPVANQDVSRTWMWGPTPVSGPLMEEYADAPNGARLVQYFDKARMEITNPDQPNSVWTVTNGLLVLELITGQRQVGDDAFVSDLPADISVAGDADDQTGPTYATFTSGLVRHANRLGDPVMTLIARDGSINNIPDLAQEQVDNRFYDAVTGHNIAGPFWTFMNSRGLINENGVLIKDLLFLNPFYATGRPVTEPYWATVKVGGQPRTVLIQCFERRCLTYAPDKTPGWQVESGNMGLHYFHWRYN